MELDNLEFMIECLTNETIDINFFFGEGTSTQCSYRPFLQISMPPKPLEPPPMNLNIDLEGVYMENSYNYHQENHSNKKKTKKKKHVSNGLIP
jgi:hypothetical protein